MTLDEIKARVQFAKKNRIRALSVDGLSFEFFERSPRKTRTPKAVEGKTALEGPKLPSLDDINRFIYENPEDHKE